MYRITPEGRRFLQSLVAKYGGRSAFGQLVGIGKNQVKPLLDAPDHSVSHATCEKLRQFATQFQEGVHYTRLDRTDDCEVRLARDRFSTKTLSPPSYAGHCTAL